MGKSCPICNSIFKTSKYRLATGHGKYCSRKCFYIGKRKRVSCKCEQCKKEFTEIPSKVKNGRGKFCSRACVNKSLVGKGIANGKKFVKGQKPWNWKGRINKNGKSGDGYILIFKPNHPSATRQGYMREHRLVMEKHLGRYLTKIEVVHHKNEDKRDNRLSNLMLFKNELKHQKHHQRR